MHVRVCVLCVRACARDSEEIIHLIFFEQFHKYHNYLSLNDRSNWNSITSFILWESLHKHHGENEKHAQNFELQYAVDINYTTQNYNTAKYRKGSIPSKLEMCRL